MGNVGDVTSQQMSQALGSNRDLGEGGGGEWISTLPTDGSAFHDVTLEDDDFFRRLGHIPVDIHHGNIQRRDQTTQRN